MFIRQHVGTMAVSLTLGLAFGTILNAQDNRPNVLFISIDDLRPELGCYENRHIQSPISHSNIILFLSSYILI